MSHESKDTRLRVHGLREALNPDIKVSPAASVARVAAGRNAPSWRLDGNILFQKPLSADRDAVDLIKNFRDNYELFVTTDGCYTATAAVESVGGPTLRAEDGAEVRNLLYAYEGCFDIS